MNLVRNMSVVFVYSTCCIITAILAQNVSNNTESIRTTVTDSLDTSSITATLNSVYFSDNETTINEFSTSGNHEKLSEVTHSSSASIEPVLNTLSDDLFGMGKKSFNENGRTCPENDKPCIIKCCPLGQSIGPDRTCEPSDLRFQVTFFGDYETPNTTVTEDIYNLIYGDPCPYGKYRLEPRLDSNDEFHILRNGSIRAPYLFPYPLMPNEFCLEVFHDDPNLAEDDVLPLICFKGPPPQSEIHLQYILYPIGLLISVPFLIATMLVYCLIPDLRDLHGKSLSCHVVCLAVAYIFLAAVQLVGDTMNQEICVGFAFMIHFSFVSCFFWLNVLCIDTWWNVRANVILRWSSSYQEKKDYLYYRRLNGEIVMEKRTERKVFVCYSLYAWCFPIVLVVISIVMDLMPTIPSSYLKPHFGDSKCWFNSGEAELQYFYAPVGFLIFVNVMLFISTAIKIFTHNWEHGETKRTPCQTFRMCLILFGVMGINWVMEVVSWAIGGPDYIWYFTDVINSLQGVIIFCVFVLEPRVRDLVRMQLWPKISEILCKCNGKQAHENVVYRSPRKATETMSGV